MGRPIIVLGDRTSKGGYVIEASMFTSTHGKGWARVGDRVSCHKNCRIIEGDPTQIDEGKAVARHGDKTSCGATLISSQIFSTISDSSSKGNLAKPAIDSLSDVPEWSDTGRNVPAAGMQPAQWIYYEEKPKLPPLAIPGETVPQDQSTSNSSRSRGDMRGRPSRPPGRAPISDQERARNESPSIYVPHEKPNENSEGLPGREEVLPIPAKGPAVEPPPMVNTQPVQPINNRDDVITEARSNGGGRNDKHASEAKRKAAEKKYEAAKAEHEKLKSTPNKTPEIKKEMETAKKAMDKAKSDMDFTGENHSSKAKGKR